MIINSVLSLLFLTNVAIASADSEHRSSTSTRQARSAEIQITQPKLEGVTAEDWRFLKEHFESLEEFSKQFQSELLTFKQVSKMKNMFEPADAEAYEQNADYKKLLNRGKRFLKGFVDNANFSRIFYAVHGNRWLDENYPHREAIRDLTILFCLSHGTESLYGVVSSLFLIIKGTTAKIFFANLGGALIIMLPGADILCWLIPGSYALSLFRPFNYVLFPYRYAVRGLRIASVWFGKTAFSSTAHALQTISRWVGKEAFTGRYEWQDSLEYLGARLEKFRPGRYALFEMGTTEGEGRVYESLTEHSEQDPFLRSKIRILIRKNQDKSSSVIHYEITNPELLDRKTIKKELAAFPYSVRNAISATFERRDAYERVFDFIRLYESSVEGRDLRSARLGIKKDKPIEIDAPLGIRNIERHEGFLRIEFEPGFVRLRPRLKKTQPRQLQLRMGCAGLF